MTEAAEKPDLWEILRRLDADLRQSARTMDSRTVRFFVDQYYSLQDFRKSGGNKKRAQAEAAKPHQVTSWVFDSMRRLEDDVKRALDEFTDEYAVGRWARSITGVGPIISAGLLTHLDIRKAPTVGHFWRFAGQDPTVLWLKKERCHALIEETIGDKKEVTDEDIVKLCGAFGRVPATMFGYMEGKRTMEKTRKVFMRLPWNAALKRILYIASDVFCKFQNHKNDYYGKLYVKRKEYEAAKNDSGDYADQASKALRDKRYRKDTDARKAYEAGKLPPKHLHMRALRHTAKLFVSHVHHAMHVDYYGKPPQVPFSFEHSPGFHRHFVDLPNWPWTGGGKPLKELLDKEQPPTKSEPEPSSDE
jgi:hypothetical protein